jgi:hypothetical protein
MGLPPVKCYPVDVKTYKKFVKEYTKRVNTGIAPIWLDNTICFGRVKLIKRIAVCRGHSCSEG